MPDCLIVGYNDFDFDENLKLVEKMGRKSGAFRDLQLSTIRYRDRYRRPLDMLTLFHAAADLNNVHRPFHDMDFLWPTILCLGSYLTKHGLTFDYINLFQFQKSVFKEKLLSGNILAIAITTTLYVHPRPILEIIEFIRKYNSSVKIVVGGPYVISQSKGLSPREFNALLKYIEADYYIISNEGEATLVELLRSLRESGRIEHIKNLAYPVNGEIVRTEDVPEQNSLEENEINYSIFKPDEIGEFLSIRTARSCPFACDYCGFPQRSGKYRYLEVELVEKELNRINDLGTVSTLTFLDDTFNVPRERFREILKVMIANKYDFKWNSYYRSDHGDPEIIELMGKAGCEGVFMGIESGSDAMLKHMRKTARTSHYRQAIPLLRQAGVATHANFIIGFPGETLDTFRETEEFIDSMAPDFFLAQLWYCDPVTPVWKRKEEMGIEGAGFVWKHATMNDDQACDLVERLFLGIRNSVWLPQWGMALWSTFYLQRRGMSLSEVKQFLKSFNNVVRHQVQSADTEQIPAPLLDALKFSCQFKNKRQGRPLATISHPDEFITSLRALDITVKLEGENIRCMRPNEPLSDEIKSQIAARKAVLVNSLR